MDILGILEDLAASLRALEQVVSATSGRPGGERETAARMVFAQRMGTAEASIENLREYKDGVRRAKKQPGAGGSYHVPVRRKRGT